jgi:hypothetical protein
MASLDESDDARIITIRGVGAPIDVPVSYFPPGSLWEVALSSDRDATELDFPTEIQGPDEVVKIEPWMAEVVADFMEVMEGGVFPIFGVDNNRMGTRMNDLRTKKLVPRPVYGTKTEYYDSTAPGYEAPGELPRNVGPGRFAIREACHAQKWHDTRGAS